MGSRTAIPAGVLAVALVAVPMGAPAAADAQDCSREGGLLSGVTNTLCDVVNVVTGTVDTLTGGATDKLTAGVDKTTDEVLGRVGEVVPTTRPSATPSDRDTPTSQPSERQEEPTRTPKPARPTRTALVPENLEDVCRGVPACVEHGIVDKPARRPTPSPERTKRPGKQRQDERDTAVVPPPVTTRPENRPQSMDTPRPVREKRADADKPRVDLLWPNPFAHELTVPMQDRRVVRPTPPASDVLGTVLTIALLGSAVLATRIVQQRRHRAEPAESIPFEPARAGNGRHRLA
ncbi:hypothetical protein E1286_23250 [Nonomuraea terrae]|uniref:Uncharacterized protein n=1 Tax=Nonomuraea terrae TaxID=2530383 RepID=A0A4R4YLA5_9ACTN|nr:hypothetical protein [Nonomuraea terrae]TDD45696.1 hypothetical protein E1286_23250 [Nonomuraea terrae]